MATAVHITEQAPYKIGTYTIEEIDDQLETCSNLLLYSHTCNKDDVRKQIDVWLDRRLDEVQFGGKDGA